jgi:hypothetical protein
MMTGGWVGEEGARAGPAPARRPPPPPPPKWGRHDQVKAEAVTG